MGTREIRLGLGVLGAALGTLLLPASGLAASDADRYTLAGGCFALQSESTGGYAERAGGGYAATADSAGAGEGFRMQATTLGRYLLFDESGRFLSADGEAIEARGKPSNRADWTVDKPAAFAIANKFTDQDLAVAGDGELVAVPAGSAGEAGRFAFEQRSGCKPYPEISTNVEGPPSKGSPRFGETSGLLEGHMHHMAFRFLAGAHCGRPWHRFGVTEALVDCVDHEPNGCAAVLENALYGDPARCHDTTGWPEFTDWPDPKSLTHEQSYYKWLERAWRGGLRVFVNLMVQNRVLCELYPIKGDNEECDDTKTVDIELDEAYRLQDYIDAQAGGPGKGFYRIVKNPFQARRVINQGKLAVILGMEVSEPFTCRMFNGVPTCDRKDISREIQHLHDRGVRQLEITNKFDNALTGVAGDNGETGTLVNTGNFYATGRFWDLEKCKTDNPEHEHDKSPTGVEHNDDLLLANAFELLIPPGALPVYPEPPLCNTMGLSELGEHAIREIIKRGMIFDPDHQSVKGRDAALNLVESRRYSGVISSHSWSTPGTLPRIYRLGGIVTPYAGDSEGFVEKWKDAKGAFEGRQYFGLGYGADQNGFGSQGGPRGTDVPNPVTYPFESFDGKQTIHQQVSGKRVYDINADGVAHYGLYPDWVEDLRQQAGNRIVKDLGRGAEAYLQMWERANGVPRARCPVWRGPFRRNGLSGRLKLRDNPRRALYRAGQPIKRERVWEWCTRIRKRAPGSRRLSKSRRVAAVFDRNGKMRMALSTLHDNRARGIGRGDSRRKLRRKARAIGARIYVRRAARGRNVFVYRLRRGKVRMTGVADRRIARSDRRLRRYVKRSGMP